MTNEVEMLNRLTLIDASCRIGDFLILVLIGVVLALIWHVRKVKV
jgi:hypothetical protein